MSEFKYPPIRIYDRNGGRMVYDYNRSVTSGYGHNTAASCTEELRLSEFFINYHSHSTQLVDALKNWSGHLRFTSCKYEDGFLDTESPIEIPPSDKGFMRYMKKHLQTETKYRPILKTALEIEEDHKLLCKKIREVSDEPVSATPSFQKIIKDGIHSNCPSLNNSRNLNLTENHIYIDFYLYKVIYGTVFRKESAITLNTKDSGRNTWVLMYQDSFALGQGEKAEMDSLKRVVEGLIFDNDIKERVFEYDKLYRELITDERIKGLENQIEELWTFINGGGYLGGFDACELCDPLKPARTRS